MEFGWIGNQAFVTFARQYYALGSDEDTRLYLDGLKPIGYRGVCNEEKDGSQIRLSLIENKNDRPICLIAYYLDAYFQHCRTYAEYQRWVKERNPERYRSNLDKNYDSKNMMHMFRLVHMASEIAEGCGVILERNEDRQFLMDVRNHKYEYDELMAKQEEDAARMNVHMAESTIPERIDMDFVNSLMIEIRQNQFP